MFSKKDLYCFYVSLLLILVAYICMIVDPAAYGFGVLTLWIAPPILLLGLLLPLMGIVGTPNISEKAVLKSIKDNRVAHISGFAVFITALSFYAITLEPTASLWDCSEFVASAYKLQVAHSPGGPLFLLIARLFSMLAWNDATNVAWSINLMSAIFSALTVYIVFHLIYFFGARITTSGKSRNVILILSGLCGSLCLTFSDTFWFSAVEAESYAAASFFLLLQVWLIVTGKDLSGDSRSRRVILIFYLAGLSYCVHPMCLLSLSLLPFYWRINNGKITITNFTLAVVIGLTIVLGINRLIAIGFFELMFAFDLFFVNTLHLPFYSGAWFMAVSLLMLFVFVLRRYSGIRSYVLALLFLFVGFVPYVMLFIRSNHNPPIDETNPENLALIKSYMNRESYPAAPLLYGPYFDAEIDAVEEKSKMYYKDSGMYKLAGTTSEYRYDKNRQTILPRMYSNDENNVRIYRQWAGLKETENPNFWDNLEFLISYQLGEMYFRYVMFNFAGRESDVQHSSWLRPWDNEKTSIQEKARNQYWMVPLIIGLIGGIYHYYKNSKDFFTVLIFFLVTGAVLAFYLNAPPNEPRERDYIYVGSFIAYCIWIGFGMMAIGNFLVKYDKTLIALTSFAIALPAWIAYQNFDDHDRSGRTFQIDNARNLLQSCAPNSILFTGGDNDTFPLWYLQEVEGFRTDVRIMVLSYLNTDWYINQLRRSYYNSPAFKLTLTEKDYVQYGPNDVLYIHDQVKEGINAKKYLDLLHEEHPALRMFSANGEAYSILPSRLLKIPVEGTIAQNISAQDPSKKLKAELQFHVVGSYLPKGALAFLDVLLSNRWERPIYFNFTSQSQIELDVRRYLVQEGLVYRLTPFESNSNEIRVDTDLMYKNLIVNGDYKNILRPDIYFNYEDFHARMIEPLRSIHNTLAIALLNENKKEKALEVLDRAVHAFYPPHIRPSFSNLQTAEILLSVGKNTWAEKLSSMVFDSTYTDVKQDLANNQAIEDLSLYLLQKSAALLTEMGRLEYEAKLNELSVFK